MKRLLTGICFILIISTFGQNNAEEDKLLQTIQKELDKNLKSLKEQPISAYFISYRIEDTETYAISASSGLVERSRKSKERLLTLQVRVGEKNKTKKMKEKDREKDKELFVTVINTMRLPLDDDYKSIEQILHQETDRAYKDAAKRYTTKIKSGYFDMETDDKNDDYANFAHKQYYEKPLSNNSLNFNIPQWEDKLKNYTLQIAKKKGSIDNSAKISFSTVRKYFVSSNGTSVVENTSNVRLFFDMETQTEDGIKTTSSKSYTAITPNELPNDDLIYADLNIKTPTFRTQNTKAQRKEQILSQLEVSVSLFLSIVQNKCEQTLQQLAELGIHLEEHQSKKKSKRTRAEYAQVEQNLQRRIASLEKRERMFLRMESEAMAFQTLLDSRPSKEVVPYETEMIVKSQQEDTPTNPENTAAVSTQPSASANQKGTAAVKTTQTSANSQPSIAEKAKEGYYVILGCFREKDNAVRYFNGLKKQYSNMIVIYEGTLYMTGSGPYPTMEEAFAKKPVDANYWIKKVETISPAKLVNR